MTRARTLHENRAIEGEGSPVLAGIVSRAILDVRNKNTVTLRTVYVLKDECHDAYIVYSNAGHCISHREGEVPQSS